VKVAYFDFHVLRIVDKKLVFLFWMYYLLMIIIFLNISRIIFNSHFFLTFNFQPSYTVLQFKTIYPKYNETQVL
jgi:hypothetical protein